MKIKHMKNYHDKYLEQALLRYVHTQLYVFQSAAVLYERTRATMSILRYLEPRDGLPDPRGPWSITLLRSAIANANREVDKVIQEKKVKGKKRGQYAM